jgi:hypothetical protein
VPKLENRIINSIFKPALAIAASIGFLLACNIDVESRTIVTRDQFGERWPLQMNSAVVECSRGGSVAVLKVGSTRYALNDGARKRGLPDAREVSRDLTTHRGRTGSEAEIAHPDELGKLCRPKTAPPFRR